GVARGVERHAAAAPVVGDGAIDDLGPDALDFLEGEVVEAAAGDGGAVAGDAVVAAGAADVEGEHLGEVGGVEDDGAGALGEDGAGAVVGGLDGGEAGGDFKAVDLAAGGPLDQDDAAGGEVGEEGDGGDEGAVGGDVDAAVGGGGVSLG